VSILIVGGAGYIGSQTAKLVAKAGQRPVVYDNLVYGHRWAAKWGPFIEGDLSDSALLTRVLKEHQVTAVIHFAAYAYVGESVTDPRKYFHNNVVNTLCLLDALVDNGVRDIVFSSTCATYGEPRQVPISEDHPQNPVNPYGESKLMVEKMLHWYQGAYGLRYAALRYFNAAGADPDGEVGEDHDPETHLIPLVLQAAIGRRPNVSIFGDDYDTPDGTCIRDYIHVSDLAEAHVLALRALDRGSRTYNLGNGNGFSVLDVIRVAREITGREVPVVRAPRRPGDVPRLLADSARIRGELGWTPSVPDLPRIVESAWRWHRDHPRGYGR